MSRTSEPSPNLVNALRLAVQQSHNPYSLACAVMDVMPLTSRERDQKIVEAAIEKTKEAAYTDEDGEIVFGPLYPSIIVNSVGPAIDPCDVYAEWKTAEAIAGTPEVDCKLRAFSEDSTHDNAVEVVRAVLETQLSCGPVTEPLDPVEGDLLPAIGSRVSIHLARQDAWVDHTVAGYLVRGDLGGNEDLHRVFVRVIGDDGYHNMRMLSKVRPANNSVTPQPPSQQAGFEQVVLPVIRWLCDNWHPHAKVVIDCTSAELVEGSMTFNTTEFVKD